MTLGTGFVGAQLDRREPGAAPPGQLDPGRLQRRCRDVPFGNFADVGVWQQPGGPVPGYPRASNLARRRAASGRRRRPAVPAGSRRYSGRRRDPAACRRRDLATAAVREQLRALILEELAQLIGG